MAIFQIGEHIPSVHASAYVVDSADVVGRVRLEAHSSIWFNVVIRGDNDDITIGENCNVQDGAVLHTDAGYPMVLGKNVTVGHRAMLHGCTIGEGALIGIGAVVLNGARIGKNCLVGAGALITEGKEFPDNMLILGSPAKAVRTLAQEDIVRMHAGARGYVTKAQLYKTSLKKIA
ncbi:MAG: gamma carbonic anhydrase family protein [Herbaspirillum sp.]|jgi:carbonic anhydrase/acetyltransferase-like protein (isoleucine patch superfamily)|nr:gamma carbonic anhydrase family protein [Herbaspirillum sp.]